MKNKNDGNIITNMDNAQIQLKISGIAIKQEDASSVVVLENPVSGNKIGIPVEPSEGRTIILESEGISSLKQDTYDILISIFADHGFCLKKAELLSINKNPGYYYGKNKYYACLEYHKGMRKWRKEVRPVDAIIISMKMNIPIFTDEKNILHSIWPIPGKKENKTKETWHFVKNREVATGFLGNQI